MFSRMGLEKLTAESLLLFCDQVFQPLEIHLAGFGPGHCVKAEKISRHFVGIQQCLAVAMDILCGDTLIQHYCRRRHFATVGVRPAEYRTLFNAIEC